MLKTGMQAPAFDLESDSGGKVNLASFAGRTVVVYFYPKDNTPGCTREAVAFSHLIEQFREANAAIVGISKDSVKSHGNFREKHALSITLLSDPDLVAHKAYGAWGEKTLYGKKVEGTLRSTFIVDAAGCVTHVFPSVKVDGHAEAVLDTIQHGPAAPGPSNAAKKPAKRTAIRP